MIDAGRLLDALAETNRVDYDGFAPYVCEGRRVGWLRPDLCEMLAGFPDVFTVDRSGIRLAGELGSRDQRTAAVSDAVRGLLGQAGFGRWNDEYAAVDWRSDGSLYDHPRCAVARFGIRSFGAHVNGYTIDGDETCMWVSERGTNRDGFDGQLDTLAGGFISAGDDPLQVARREAVEEASIDDGLLPAITAAGAIKGQREFPFGLSPYGVFCFDLRLPAGYRPTPQDDEVAGFELMSADVLLDALEHQRFKFNAVPVVIDWLLRYGQVDPRDTRYIALSAAVQTWDPD
ncbi:MAG: DUF4743 domain-containing protein [Rhodospirillales bacterium]